MRIFSSHRHVSYFVVRCEHENSYYMLPTCWVDEREKVL